MANSNAFGFLARKEILDRPLPGPGSMSEDMERLVKVMKTWKIVPLTDIVRLTGLAADTAAPLVNQLIRDGHAKVTERTDRPGERMLTLL